MQAAPSSPKPLYPRLKPKVSALPFPVSRLVASCFLNLPAAMPPAQDSVNPTISQDRVTGASAKEESYFRLLEGGLKAWNSRNHPSPPSPLLPLSYSDFTRSRRGPSKLDYHDQIAEMANEMPANEIPKRTRSSSGQSEGRSSCSESPARDQAKASVTQPDRKRRKRRTSCQSQSSNDSDKVI